MSDDPTEYAVPAAMCWHCDRLLDAAGDVVGQKEQPTPGSISLCLYCGAIGVFGEGLELGRPTEALLDELEQNAEFRRTWVGFMWARNRLLLKVSLLGHDAETEARRLDEGDSSD